MAKLLYNALAPQFSLRALVSLDLKDSNPQLKKHLAQLLEDLGMSGQKQHSLSQLQTRLHRHLQGKAVLLVVDNVWTAEQLDALLPPARCFGAGSRVVITSRMAFLADSVSYKVGVRRQLGQGVHTCHESYMTTSACYMVGAGWLLAATGVDICS
jgi:hypothetical protein